MYIRLNHKSDHILNMNNCKKVWQIVIYSDIINILLASRKQFVIYFTRSHVGFLDSKLNQI